MFLFLDIDGVMVPAKGWKAPVLLNDGFPAFSDKATLALKSLMTDNTTIVLTTSHRANYTLKQWIDIFKNRNIDIERLVSLDKNINNLSRKAEIMNWITLKSLERNFIIIDDDKSLNDLPPDLKKYLVLTSATVGLTHGDAERAKAIKNELALT